MSIISSFSNMVLDCQYQVLKYMSPVERIKYERVCSTFRDIFESVWLSQRTIFVYGDVFESSRTTYFRLNEMEECIIKSHRVKECNFIELSNSLLVDNCSNMVKRCLNLTSFYWHVYEA